MKERFYKIMKGLLVALFSGAGLWEYLQVFMYYDMPQAVIVVPIIGCLAAVFLKKLSFAVVAATAVFSIVYQLIQKNINSLGIVENSKFNIILNILPVILILMLIGIAGGFLIRVLVQAVLKQEKKLVKGIVCAVFGLILTLGVGILFYGNPLYPAQARMAIHKYSEKYEDPSYPVSEVIVYYSYSDMEYQGRVVMSDGVCYALYHEKKTGSVTEVGHALSGQ